jgi:hypothetical protein
MFRNSSILKIMSVIAIIGLAVVVYLLLIRPGQLRWGATDEEISRPMLGDELVPDPTYNSTRAITIEASPEEIWPWLVQMGYGRAGFYGYDLIENLGSERGLHSAESILPELQQLAVGDEMPISIIATYVIHTMESNQFLVWADANEGGGVFTWGLYPIDESHTRLVFRFRFRHSWIDWLLTDWADHIAVRKILLGVKDRAEGRVEPMAVQNAEIALWGVAFLEFIAAIILIFIRKLWRRGWLVALAAVGVLLVVLFLHPPLWTRILLEIGILMGLILSFQSSNGSPAHQ